MYAYSIMYLVRANLNDEKHPRRHSILCLPGGVGGGDDKKQFVLMTCDVTARLCEEIAPRAMRYTLCTRCFFFAGVC